MGNLNTVATATRQLYAIARGRGNDPLAAGLGATADALDALAAEVERLGAGVGAIPRHTLDCECRACCLARMVRFGS